MKKRRFALQPFPTLGPRPGVEITGEIVRRAEVLSLDYLLQGRLAEVLIPAPLTVPARRHRLWQETCFECFLAIRGSTHYWEFNLSPAGSWNVYQFTDYRRGMVEETALTSLPFKVHSGPGAWRLSAAVDLARIIPAGQALEVGLAAILKLENGETNYWALTHPGPQADFHRRDSFLMTF